MSVDTVVGSQAVELLFCDLTTTLPRGHAVWRIYIYILRTYGTIIRTTVVIWGREMEQGVMVSRPHENRGGFLARPSFPACFPVCFIYIVFNMRLCLHGCVVEDTQAGKY